MASLVDLVDEVYRKGYVRGLVTGLLISAILSPVILYCVIQVFK